MKVVKDNHNARLLGKVQERVPSCWHQPDAGLACWTGTAVLSLQRWKYMPAAVQQVGDGGS